MTKCDRSSMAERPVPTGTDGGSIPTRPLQVNLIPIKDAREFIMKWHSRLPVVQKGPWAHAFGAFAADGELVAAALWHNCSARNLPQNWRELRRMAIADFPPPNTATIMLAQMRRWFKKNSAAEVLISYQDLDVHVGTIYKADNWVPVARSRPRTRSRTVADQAWTKGRNAYRTDTNTVTVSASAKIRWQYPMRGQTFVALTQDEIEEARNWKITL